MTALTTVPEVLRAAADEVEKAWCQKVASKPNGAVCARGALARVAGVGTLMFDAYAAVSSTAKRKFGACGLIAYNDDLAKDRFDVANLLRLAADEYEATA
jgi:hypothetical protein